MTRRRTPRFMDRGMRMWIIRYAGKNLWRIPPWMDLDDLIQDGFLSYAICIARYGDRVENRRHFMALTKIVFTNHITDLANDRTAAPFEVQFSQLVDEGQEESRVLDEIMGREQPDAELMALLATAPEEIRKFMWLMQDPAALERLQRPLRYRCGGQRDSTRARIARMLGLDPALDIEAMLRALIAGEPLEAST